MDQDKPTNPQTGPTEVHRETVITSPSKPSTGLLAQRIIWYIAGIIIALLALRMILLLLAANQGSAFVDFIYGLSGVFAWPFFGIFSYQPAYGEAVFEISSLVAIIVYGLVAAGLAKLFSLNSSEERAV